MKCVSGTFNGTGAAVYIACGFVPDEVIVMAPGDAGAVAPHIYWDKNMRDASAIEGVLIPGAGDTQDDLAAGAGIQPYEGGVLLTAALQTSVAYGEGVYLVRDDRDYRYGPDLAPMNQSGDAVAVNIDTWTLDTSANRTGHFNEDVTGDYIGAGSRVLISRGGEARPKEYWATIEALTATQGEAADEVTLSRAIGSGTIRFIGGMYDYKPQAVGEQTLAGFLLSSTTVVNVNDELQSFKAIKYDD